MSDETDRDEANPVVRVERRHHRTWGERFFLEPIYFWLDLYGHDGRPSHHKVLLAWGFFIALGQELRWAGKLESLDEITWPYVALVALTLSIPMGKNVFMAVLGARFGNGGTRPPRRPRPGGQELG